ncbi:DNA polymerase epsilon catalytic subunit A isoform X1 [Arachis hypogaea]|uniref:DNA polymerase epsilon catalytic subunit A isoform X1 n=1 Tax=Arachis hypogaea TaxID=3818 RepID=UPI003B20D30F
MYGAAVLDAYEQIKVRMEPVASWNNFNSFAEHIQNRYHGTYSPIRRIKILGWQQVAEKIGMQHCAASGQWLNERIALSRYAHVPLGNFELDWLIFTADTFFSRALRDSQQVLIVSLCI